MARLQRRGYHANRAAGSMSWSLAPCRRVFGPNVTKSLCFSAGVRSAGNGFTPPQILNPMPLKSCTRCPWPAASNGASHPQSIFSTFDHSPHALSTISQLGSRRVQVSMKSDLIAEKANTFELGTRLQRSRAHRHLWVYPDSRCHRQSA